jgi:hypothetical protein
VFKKKSGSLANICIIVSFILLLFIHTTLADEVKTKEKTANPMEQYIKVKEGLLSVNLKDADIAGVLKEIGRQAAIEVKIDQSLKHKINADFANMDLEEGLKKLVKENYAVVVTKVPAHGNASKYKVYQIITIASSKKNYKKAISKSVDYGIGKERVGMLLVKSLPPLGPESFSNDSEGNLYICDTVNHRIQVFSPDGNYKFTVPLNKRIMANDIAIDNLAFIYVYDDLQGKLYQYDKFGDVINEIKVDNTRWSSRRPLHIVDDKIYIKSSDGREMLIGKITKGLLVAPTKDDLLKSSEIGALGKFSARKYPVSLIRGEKAVMDIVDMGGAKIKSIELPIKGIASIEFLQEDIMGNFYIQTERVENERIILEVHKFNLNGNFLTTISIPENDYHSWSVKLLSVDERGNIFQFLPGEKSAQLIVFQQK